jgi:hypothetical protein
MSYGSPLKVNSEDPQQHEDLYEASPVPLARDSQGSAAPFAPSDEPDTGFNHNGGKTQRENLSREDQDRHLRSVTVRSIWDECVQQSLNCHCVSWKPRDGPSARLGLALGRLNPVEQTGLCIYSCLRTYRSALFNRVLSNPPTHCLPMLAHVCIWLPF